MEALLQDLQRHESQVLLSSALLQRLSVEFYQQELHLSNGAFKYVREERLIDLDTVRQWGLGFGSSSSRFTSWLQKTITQDQLRVLLEIGMLKPLEKGSVLHMHANRITIPIHDLQRNVIGFGSRKFLEQDNGQKYLNNPASWLYQKSLVLYGLGHALDGIQKFGCVVVVEGYFDVIALHSIGITCAVAPCGTALMEEHLHILKCFTNKVVMWFDRDEAGRRAAKKTKELCTKVGMECQDSVMEAFKDPDEAVRAGEISQIFDCLGLQQS